MKLKYPFLSDIKIKRRINRRERREEIKIKLSELCELGGERKFGLYAKHFLYFS